MQNETIKLQPKKWYQQPGWVIAVLILFFPIGLYLMWKNNVFSKTARILITVFFALMILIQMGKDENTMTKTSNSTKDEKEPSSQLKQSQKTDDDHQPTVEHKSGKNLKSLGDTFQLGNFSYRIDKIAKSNRVGNEYVHEDASTGATFLYVYFTILNISNETKTVITDDFILIDSQHRRFHPSSNANTSLAMTEGKDFILTELQPGIQKSSLTIFEIPQESLSPGLVVEIPEKGILGTDEVFVELIP